MRVRPSRGDGAAVPLARLLELKNIDGTAIWLSGGCQLAGVLRGEVNELVVARHPIVLGTGVPLLDGSFASQLVDRTGSQTFDTGEVPKVSRRADCQSKLMGARLASRSGSRRCTGGGELAAEAARSKYAMGGSFEFDH